MSVLRLFFFSLLALTLSVRAQVDWRVHTGWQALQAELGAGLPSGSGIAVFQSEASTTPHPGITYLPEGTAGTVPFSGTGNFAGKTFTPHSGASAQSGHAVTVGSYFYGSTTSMTPGITMVHCYVADDFVNGLMQGVDTVPLVFPGSVQNHSWVGSVGSESGNAYFLRRLDFMIQRDGVVSITPLNNGGVMYELLSNAWHSITPGLLNGNHPQGGTISDGVGRMKPDLVVDVGQTSLAGPAVASAAALLLDAIRPAFPQADDPRVVKAILLASASKNSLPGWRRVALDKPYDLVHGAGVLNVQRAWHVLAADEQMPSPSVPVAMRGWHGGISSASDPVRYFFTIPEGRWAETFSAALTWYREVGLPFDTSSLVNLDLKLYRASGLVITGVPLTQSVSVVDNVEHVFFRNLPAGEYALEIPAASAAAGYGLAWDTQLGAGPVLSLSYNGASQPVLSLTSLDPYVTYSIEAGSELTAGTWSVLTTVRTADTVPSPSASWTDTTAALSTRRFYRLRWTYPP
jgi:hypothetical protein